VRVDEIKVTREASRQLGLGLEMPPQP
jgi:hypothetical protein